MKKIKESDIHDNLNVTGSDTTAMMSDAFNAVICC